jgi:hypothetical protein
MPPFSPDGQFDSSPGQIGEAVGLLEQNVERLLGPRTDLRHADRRRHLEQDVADVDQVAAAKLGGVPIVVALHLLVGRLGDGDLAAQQVLDRPGDDVLVGLIHLEQAAAHRALAQQLAGGGEFEGLALQGRHRHAVDRGGHGRAVFLLRRSGVRTI